MFDADKYEGNEEDERRLFYVAITRAIDVLLLSYFGNGENSSPFIRNLDGRLYSQIANDEHLPRNVIMKPSSAPYEKMQSFSAGEIITYKICPHVLIFIYSTETVQSCCHLFLLVCILLTVLN